MRGTALPLHKENRDINKVRPDDYIYQAVIREISAWVNTGLILNSTVTYTQKTYKLQGVRGEIIDDHVYYLDAYMAIKMKDSIKHGKTLFCTEGK